jgi:hypothetical protein
VGTQFTLRRHEYKKREIIALCNLTLASSLASACVSLNVNSAPSESTAQISLARFKKEALAARRKSSLRAIRVAIRHIQEAAANVAIWWASEFVASVYVFERCVIRSILSPHLEAYQDRSQPPPLPAKLTAHSMPRAAVCV